MYWQSHIIESTVDEDVDTDNEQIKVAGLHTLMEMREAFGLFANSGWKVLRNKPRLRNN
jgi:hypothetical protein